MANPTTTNGQFTAQNQGQAQNQNPFTAPVANNGTISSTVPGASPIAGYPGFPGVPFATPGFVNPAFASQGFFNPTMNAPWNAGIGYGGTYPTFNNPSAFYQGNQTPWFSGVGSLPWGGIPAYGQTTAFGAPITGWNTTPWQNIAPGFINPAFGYQGFGTQGPVNSGSNGFFNPTTFNRNVTPWNGVNSFANPWGVQANPFTQSNPFIQSYPSFQNTWQSPFQNAWQNTWQNPWNNAFTGQTQPSIQTPWSPTGQYGMNTVNPFTAYNPWNSIGTLAAQYAAACQSLGGDCSCPPGACYGTPTNTTPFTNAFGTPSFTQGFGGNYGYTQPYGYTQSYGYTQPFGSNQVNLPGTPWTIPSFNNTFNPFTVGFNGLGGTLNGFNNAYTNGSTNGYTNTFNTPFGTNTGATVLNGSIGNAFGVPAFGQYPGTFAQNYLNAITQNAIQNEIGTIAQSGYPTAVNPGFVSGGFNPILARWNVGGSAFHPYLNSFYNNTPSAAVLSGFAGGVNPYFGHQFGVPSGFHGVAQNTVTGQTPIQNVTPAGQTVANAASLVGCCRAAA